VIVLNNLFSFLRFVGKMDFVNCRMQTFHDGFTECTWCVFFRKAKST
jgi:hypothetical protein